MDYPDQKKGRVPSPVLGYVVLISAQSAIRDDPHAVFVPKEDKNGYRVVKQLPSCGIELLLESAAGSMDTRETYSDFLVRGRFFYTTSNKEASGSPTVLAREIETYVNDVLRTIQTLKLVKPPRLERVVCTWCPADVMRVVTWNEEYKEWECKYHGGLPDDQLEKEMIYPFFR